MDGALWMLRCCRRCRGVDVDFVGTATWQSPLLDLIVERISASLRIENLHTVANKYRYLRHLMYWAIYSLPTYM